MTINPIAYTAFIQQDGPTDFIVTFPEVPEAITQGDSLAGARSAAYDALNTALDLIYLNDGRDFPTAAVSSAAYAWPPRDIPPNVTTWLTAVEPKLAARERLRREMRTLGMSNVGLAKAMGKDEKAVRLILSGRGASLDRTLEALRAVGVRPALAA